MKTRIASPDPGTHASPFRNDAIIADGRRERLLVRRREELANMPDSVRGVYVARTARIAAALIASLFALTLIASSVLSDVAVWVASVVPGRNPAVLSSLLFAAVLGGSLAYLLARARAERSFARAMSLCVTPTADAHADVERLSRLSPESLGRSMAQRHELAGIALPMLAAAALVPCAAVYLCMALVEWGYPRPSAFDDTLLAFPAQLVASALLGLAAAAFVAPRLARLSGNQLVQVRNTALAMLVPSVPLALWGLMSSTAIATWACGGAAALSLLVLVAAQKVRSERARLGIAEDVTVAELTLKDVLRSAWTTLVAVPRTLNPFTLRQRLAARSTREARGDDRGAVSPAATAFSQPLPKAIAAASIAAILGTVAYSSISPVVRDANAADRVDSLDPDDANGSRRLVPIAHGPSTVRVIPDHDDERAGLVVEIRFRDGDPAEWTLPLSQPGAGFGWRFAVSVTLVDSDGAPATDDSTGVLLTPFFDEDFGASALPITHERPVAVFNKLICSEELGLGLRIVPKGQWAEGTHTVRLRYEPFMSLADSCDLIREY